jgi:hypothetical protein
VLSGIADIRTCPKLDGKNFLVCVGAMRCGTSWLWHYLRPLPEVAVSPIKEVHFFDAKFPGNALGEMNAFAVKRLAFHAGREGDAAASAFHSPSFRASVDRVQMIYDDNAYFDHFARLCSDETSTLCDITPGYAVIGSTGFEYMRDFFATQTVRLKLAFVMRDPVDRLWSQLRHMQSINPEAKTAERWREAIEAPRIIARADYRGTVRVLDDIFPADDILYLFYEDVFAEPALRRLCTFAGVKYQPGRPRQRQNEATLELTAPDGARDEFRRVLAPQYAFCRERFGHLVPDGWSS